jgi:adenine C2-methylase RlmN of 23S rRNA A2503 and tRNA A37
VRLYDHLPEFSEELTNSRPVITARATRAAMPPFFPAKVIEDMMIPAAVAQSKITISTVAPDPSAFATLGSAPAALAWSVHAVDDSLRRQLVPTTKVSTTEWNGKHTSQPNSFVFLIRDTYSVLNGGTTSWTCESTVVEIKQTA